MNEWRPIPGYPGYEVSDEGSVRSSKYRQPRLLKPTTNPQTGYKQVYLRADGRTHTWRVHALVLLAFVGPRPEGDVQVRHLDGDRLNNRLANLAYGTRSENMRDAVEHGTHYWARQTHCAAGHEYTPANTYVQPGRNRRACRTCTTESHRRTRVTNQKVSAA